MQPDLLELSEVGVFVVQVLRAITGLDLPNNPLDQLIDMLGGPAAVAEMTGRKGRLVRRKTG